MELKWLLMQQPKQWKSSRSLPSGQKEAFAAGFQELTAKLGLRQMNSFKVEKHSLHNYQILFFSLHTQVERRQRRRRIGGELKGGLIKRQSYNVLRIKLGEMICRQNGDDACKSQMAIIFLLDLLYLIDLFQFARCDHPNAIVLAEFSLLVTIVGDRHFVQKVPVRRHSGRCSSSG
jgi:hypothetical protein